MSGDADLARQLRAMWERADPAPADLADRVLFTLGLQDVEFELMLLADAAVPADVRLTVVVVLPGDRAARRLDGWLSPRAALLVELRTRTRSWHTTADDDGRFAFDDLPSGLGQLVVRPTPGAAVELAVTLITPSIWI